MCYPSILLRVERDFDGAEAACGAGMADRLTPAHSLEGFQRSVTDTLARR